MQIHSQVQSSHVHTTFECAFYANQSLFARGQLEQISFFVAFDKQYVLELHLKWTQAFNMACDIPLNTIRNPTFQDALMSTPKQIFVQFDYNKMHTECVDKVKKSIEAILKRIVLDFVPSFGFSIALDGWTNYKKCPLTVT